jgi:hypothetical protein
MGILRHETHSVTGKSSFLRETSLRDACVGGWLHLGGLPEQEPGVGQEREHGSTLTLSRDENKQNKGGITYFEASSRLLACPDN